MDRRNTMAIAAVAAKATSSRVAEMTDPAIRYKTSQAAAEPPARAQRLRLRGGKGARAAFLLAIPLSCVIELPPLPWANESRPSTEDAGGPGVSQRKPASFQTSGICHDVISPTAGRLAVWNHAPGKGETACEAL